MRIAASLVVVIALASPALADVKRHADVPESIQGSWAPNADGCKANDKSLIVLAAKAYTSGDTTCAVDWVSETAGPSGPIYSAHMRCTAQPPKKATVTNVIIRPDDAKQVSIGPHFSNLKAYQKCPAKE